MSKKKNKSNSVQEGAVIRTRDSNILNGVDTKDDHPNKKDYYRGAIIIETTIDDKLGIVKITSKGTISIDKNTKIKPFLEIFDDEGRYIRINQKFVLDRSGKAYSKNTVNTIKKCLYISNITARRLRLRNKMLSRLLKNRK